MNFFQNLSIRNKMIVIILAVTLVIIGVAFPVIILNDIQTFKKDKVDETIASARLVGHYCVSALAFGDSTGAVRELEKMEVNPSFLGISIYDEKGHLFAAFTGAGETSIPFSIQTTPIFEFTANYLKVIEPIIFQDESYGFIQIHISTELLQSKIENYLLMMIALMAGMIVLSYFIASGLQRLISRPILKLARITEQVSNEADYSLHVEKSGNDEIGVLCDGFNNMLGQIHIREMERNQAETALRENEEKYRILFNSGNDAVFVHSITKDGFPDCFVEVNETACKRLGYTKEEFLKLSPKDIDDPNQVQKIPKIMEILFKKKHAMFETYHVTKEGMKIPVEINAHLFELHGQKIILSIARDITERKNTEKELTVYREHLEDLVEERTDELMQINQKLEDANRELESFSYSVSHDLRAPLRAIHGFSQVLMEDHTKSLNKEGFRVLDIINSNTKKMGQLIDDLLEFSRMGRREMGFTKINMSNLVQEVFLDQTNLAPEYPIDLQLEAIPDSWGDRSMIQQVLVNLIANAIKFSKKTKAIKIEVGGFEKDNDNIYYIKDFGVGFNMKYADKLFGVFKRLHSSDEFEGTGVGLALVQRIIHRHGGRVWAEGKENKGATFYFSLKKRGDNNES